MKYLLGTVLLLALTAVGCVTEHQQIIKTPAKQPAPPAPPPVSASQVNGENAHAVSQALWDEMDRQSQNELLDNAKTSPAKK